MSGIAEFQNALERFLNGETDFAELNDVRRSVLATDPQSAAGIQALVEDLYANGRLPQQLYGALSTGVGEQALPSESTVVGRPTDPRTRARAAPAGPAQGGDTVRSDAPLATRRAGGTKPGTASGKPVQPEVGVRPALTVGSIIKDRFVLESVTRRRWHGRRFRRQGPS